ncbi:MAG: cytochrome c3 family protein [Planctomycetes bacterium]|nr:cytochrome c3 family protein [Planctomycetota bacterium]
MKQIYLGVLLSSLVVLLVAGLRVSGVVCWQMPNLLPTVVAHEQEKSDLPPLIMDDDEPLLLLEEPKEEDKSAAEIQALAESQPCFVCHVNYQKEGLAAKHAKMGFSCVTCHGDSFAHRNDENNTTPPDIMYPANQIGKKCLTCHKTHDAPARKVIARWQTRCPDKTDPKTILCTDCHGQHRLKIRTVRWDKTTGKLLPAAPPN